jgi:cytochrome P450
MFLLGSRIHVISDVNSFSSIQRKPKLFSFTPLMHELAQRLKGLPFDFETTYVSKLRGAAMSVSKFLQGEPLEKLTKVYGRLTLERLNNYFDTHNGELIVDTHYFVRTILYYASSKSILGEDFDSDSTEKDFFTYDDGIRLLGAGIPAMFMKSCLDARKRVIEVVKKLDLSKACEFVANSTNEEETQEEIAELGFGMLNASQTNTISASFWTFYEIMKDPETKKKVLNEIENNFSVDEYEKSIDSMKVLNGAYLESNRFHNIGVSLRQAMEDAKVEVNGKSYKIRKGDKLFLMPVSYQDPGLYENPEKYNPERYVGVVSDKVKDSQTPYGGGIHLCPGRFFAINEIKLFTIILLKYFNCEFVEEKSLGNAETLSYVPPNGDIKMKISRIK